MRFSGTFQGALRGKISRQKEAGDLPGASGGSPRNSKK